MKKLAWSWQIEGEKVEVVTDFISLDSKITADGDCSHEIRRHLLPGRHLSMTTLDSILKSRDITLLMKVHIVKSYGFSSNHVRMWELDHREGRESKNWCFWIVVLEKLLESSLDSKEIKTLNAKGNQPWMFSGRTDAEALILWPHDMKSRLTGEKNPDAEKDWRKKETGAGEDERVR